MSTVDAEFLEIFREEARERLDAIVETLLAIEADRAPDGAIDVLFRHTHTLKGAAGMVGLTDVQQLAHAMEDVLDESRASGRLERDLIDPLLRSADTLHAHVEGRGGPVAALVDELTRGVPAAPVVEPASPAPRERRPIRVAPEKIDTLLDLVGETVLHRRRLEHVLHADGHAAERSVADELDSGGRLLDGLKDAAIGMRTLPLATILGSLPRVVRDLAVEAGKEVDLEVEGADTELDRLILERLSEVLIHLFRNSIAHGIESPAERERAGKPARGRLQLRAEQRGGTIEITVADDGRGVPEAALAEARRTGSLVAVLTKAGYSTATEVNSISGRGVGLDAVKAQVDAIGGSLEITSTPDDGTAVVLSLPLALALIDVLLVERGGNVYGLPLASVEEVISVDETLSLVGRPALELRGATVPVADLAALVGTSAPPHQGAAPAIVVQQARARVAATCDRLLGKEQVVVKSLGALLRNVHTYLGAAILGDGRIALLVDPGALVGNSRRPALERPAVAESEAAATIRKVLVVEDSLVVRELQRGILEAAGYAVVTARNGREGLERLGADDGIELVVTDVEMPELDGIGLTKAIRANPEQSSLPVVVVTSRGEDEDRQRGFDAGADAYIVKGDFSQHALLETVGRLIGR
jgi:two-component system, chemotaxis family, sensor kinase CheA